MTLNGKLHKSSIQKVINVIEKDLKIYKTFVICSENFHIHLSSKTQQNILNFFKNDDI